VSTDTNALTPAATPAAPTMPSAPALTPAAPATDEAAVLARALADANTRAGTMAQQLAALTGERDGLREQVGKLEPVAKEVDALRVQVQGFVNQGREAALLGGLQAKLPGADLLALKGVVVALAERGAANRYPEDPAAEVARVLPIVSAEAPGLTRPPTSGGGSPGARSTPAQPVRKSLVG
jgi:hypothetical protein